MQNAMSAGFLSQEKFVTAPYTLFAPTDAAFVAAIAQGSLLCGEGRRCIDLLDWVHSTEYASKDISRHGELLGSFLCCRYINSCLGVKFIPNISGKMLLDPSAEPMCSIWSFLEYDGTHQIF